MTHSAFFEFEFLALIASSIVAPSAIFAVMAWKRAISRITVFAFGVTLIILSVIDVALLETLDTAANGTSSIVDDQFFASEVSIALYVLPAVLAGIGSNVLSHLLIRHVQDAENRFDRDHPNTNSPGRD
jgi:hypothetical protein